MVVVVVAGVVCVVEVDVELAVDVIVVVVVTVVDEDVPSATAGHSTGWMNVVWLVRDDRSDTAEKLR